MDTLENAPANTAPGESVDFASAGPGTPGGTWLRQYWQPVYVSADLKPGKAVPIHVMGEKFTLYRGEEGAAHVVAFRCAHRSAQLSTGWVRGDCIKCMYHGWTYDGDGKCVERPGEKNQGAFAKADIASYPTREFLGLIYAWIGEGEPAPFPPFYGFKDEGTIENHVLEFPSNWFQTMENHFDEAHLAFVHSYSGSHDNLGRGYQLPEINVYETAYGMVRETNKPGDAKVRKTLYILPNIMRIIIPAFGELDEVGGWRDTYITLVPTDDETHRVYFTQNVHIPKGQKKAWKKVHKSFAKRVAENPPVAQLAEEILAGKGHLTDYTGHPFLLLLEDAITQGGQGRIVDRSHEILGRTDVGIAVFRRVAERELRAIQAGKPTKDWAPLDEEPVLGF